MGTHNHYGDHHHYGGGTAILAKLDELIARTARLETLMIDNAAHQAALDDLAAVAKKLADDETLDEQMVRAKEAEIAELKARLDAVPPDDTEQIKALTAQVKVADDKLSALISGNAPAPPAPDSTTDSTTDASGTVSTGTDSSPDGTLTGSSFSAGTGFGEPSDH